MDVKTAIINRRSIRKFKQDPIPNEYVTELLEAARLAPSGTNHQPWRFIVIRNKIVQQKIQEVAYGQTCLSEAPVLLVCCADIQTYAKDTARRVQELVEVGAMEKETADKYPGLNQPKDEQALKTYIPHAMLNVAIAMQNIALRAVSLGLGTCIIQLMKVKKIAGILDLPDNIIITALMPVGFSNENPDPRPRVPLDELIYRVI
ncbi:nitroreductase family protein [Sporomusa malonica]|uniref:nitroreductase family protein n=1 Tax=Sporomusa malonica TaxID=112901 RepID=UPI0009FF593D|nr:nitroreductase family protein [Sporomusa malonica]